MSQLHKYEIRRLRADARKLEAVARHLREQARQLSREDKAETTRVNFFAKKSKIDENLVLNPDNPPIQTVEEVMTEAVN